MGSSTDVCANLTIQSGAVLTSNNGSYKLTASTIDLQSGGEIDIDNGEIECTGAFSHSGVLDMSGGTLDINGEYTSAATCTETIAGGTITISGAWTGTNGNNFTPNGGTVTFDGSSDKIILTHSDANFYHLTISNTGGDVEVDTDIDVNGDYEIVVTGYGAPNEVYNHQDGTWVDQAPDSIKDPTRRAIGVAACDVDGSRVIT